MRLHGIICAVTVGLVLAGGGARGAYEAGVLAELLPWLEERGERPTVLVGTSVGALAAAFLASVAHLPAREAADELLARWGAVTQERVIRPILRHQSPRTLLRYLAEFAGVPVVRLESFLDASPLRRTVSEWLDWESVRANLAAGSVDALAVVATSATTERAVVFVETHEQTPAPDATLVDYMPGPLGDEHVLASAAIPVFFRSVRVGSEADAGWFFDGGTRLNTPIKPALDLGVDRVVVVATHAPFHRPEQIPADREGASPDFADGMLELVQATLVDPLIQDLRNLGKINLLAERLGRERARPYRTVPYLFAGPGDVGRLGRLVADVHARHFAGPVASVRAPDVTLLTRLLGGPSPAHAELLSYLFFQPQFVSMAIEAGRQDARELLASGDPWRTGPIERPVARPGSDAGVG
jgi:NTE family protein